MKKMILLVAVMAAMVMVFTGCNGVLGVTGSGDLVTKEIDVDAVETITAGNSFDVEVIYGDVPSVTVKYDDNLEEYLDVYERNGNLHIGLKDNKLYNRVKVSAVVVTNQLERIDGSGATSFDIDNDMKYTDNFSLELSGSSKFDGNITSDKVKFDLSGNSEAKGSLETDRLTIGLSGASDIRFDGTGNDVYVNISGSSQVDFKNFEANTLDVEASGSSSLDMKVADELSANASGASDITVYGDPDVRRSETSGSSDINIK